MKELFRNTPMPQATILVVDDNPTPMKLAASCLQTQGYRLVTAGDGEEALRKAVSEKPDLIVLDVILPGQNGFQICQRLKTSIDTSKIPVVMLTSKNQHSDRFWGMKQGADVYLTKPFDDADFFATIARHLPVL
jgi:twitching motility two-component system response regulator PilH